MYVSNPDAHDFLTRDIREFVAPDSQDPDMADGLGIRKRVKYKESDAEISKRNKDNFDFMPATQSLLHARVASVSSIETDDLPQRAKTRDSTSDVTKSSAGAKMPARRSNSASVCVCSRERANVCVCLRERVCVCLWCWIV